METADLHGLIWGDITHTDFSNIGVGDWKQLSDTIWDRIAGALKNTRIDENNIYIEKIEIAAKKFNYDVKHKALVKKDDFVRRIKELKATEQN